MKRSCVLLTLMILSVAGWSLSASANFTNATITPNENDFTLTIEGSTNLPYHPNVVVEYTISFNPSIVNNIHGVVYLREDAGDYVIGENGDGYFTVVLTIPWPDRLCGDFEVNSVINLYSLLDYPDGSCATYVPDTVTAHIDCQQECPGTGTPGYWKNHFEVWPEQFTIGAITYGVDAPLEDALGWLNTKDGDKTITLFRALVAAVLNVEAGCSSDCISDILVAAQEWMSNHPVGSGVKAKSSAWQDGGESMYLVLDQYNNGELCVPSRDVIENNEEYEGAGKIALSSEIQGFTLLQNNPNPFNPVTTISFSLPDPGFVRLVVYNALGKKVDTLADSEFSAGTHSIQWNASDYASGVYYYRIETGSFVQSKRMLLVK